MTKTIEIEASAEQVDVYDKDEIQYAKSDTKVVAIGQGYYENIIRKPGEAFVLRKGDAFGKWMEKADANQPLGEPVEGTAKARPLYERDLAPADAYGDTMAHEKPLSRMSKAELVSTAQEEGVSVTPDSMTNKQIIDAIEAARAKTGETLM